jgi:hypothetical protein
MYRAPLGSLNFSWVSNHEVNEAVKEISSIVRTGCRFWVILNAESTAFCEFKTFDNTIIK